MDPIYDRDGIVLYCGRCEDILPALGQFALLLTDPPYGVTQNEWDVPLDINAWWRQVASMDIGGVVMTSQQPFTTDNVVAARDWFKWSDVWHKSQARGHLNANVMPLREHEDILVFAPGKMTYNPQFRQKHPCNVRPNTPRTKQTGCYGTHGLASSRTIPPDMSYPRSVIYCENSQDGQHPTQKPLALFRLLVRQYSNAGETILDPFCGSGTTLVAAKLGTVPLDAHRQTGPLSCWNPRPNNGLELPQDSDSLLSFLALDGDGGSWVLPRLVGNRYDHDQLFFVILVGGFADVLGVDVVLHGSLLICDHPFRGVLDERCHCVSLLCC